MSDADPSASRTGLSGPSIKTIHWQDIVDSLVAGMLDLKAEPAYGLFFGGIYALGGLIIIACLGWLNASYLAYPLAAGFVMVGPFVASGLYEVSRRRETGLPLSFPIVLTFVWSQRQRELAWMAFVSMFIMVIWLYQVRLLIALFLGLQTFSSIGEFITVVTTTSQGIIFLLVGHVIGAILALLAFSLSVVSFPLLVDRDVDFITAIITSFRAVALNPQVMLTWAFCVVALMMVGLMSAFVGLVVILPVLGHATWHLFRRLVEPAPSRSDLH